MDPKLPPGVFSPLEAILEVKFSSAFFQKLCGIFRRTLGKHGLQNVPKRRPECAPKCAPKSVPKRHPKHAPKCAPKSAPKRHLKCAQKRVPKRHPNEASKRHPNVERRSFKSLPKHHLKFAPKPALCIFKLEFSIWVFAIYFFFL